MSNYLQNNETYYKNGYDAENVESYVFRAYGRIFKHDFGLTGKNHEKVLDFGCGQGSALRFLKSKGFDVYGADMSDKDLNVAREMMPDVANHFLTIPSKPVANKRYFDVDFDLVISIQTLYFLSDTDFKIALKNIYDSMKPGAIIYASMMGTRCYFYNHAKPLNDGLYAINFKNDRIECNDLSITFVRDENELREKFSLFKKVYIGHYDRNYREEGSEFHYTFVGQKI